METLEHTFVDAIPDVLEEGVIYISCLRRTAIHLCVCGCRNEVVTPISPTDWQLKFDGETVSLSPSIGLWEFKCRSHYWIIKNRVRYSDSWSDRQVTEGRKREKRRRDQYYSNKMDVVTKEPSIITIEDTSKPKRNWFAYLKALFNF